MGELLPLKPQPSKPSCGTVTKKKVFGLATVSSEVLGFFLFSVDGCSFHCLTVFSHTTTHVFVCVCVIYSLSFYNAKENQTSKTAAPNHDISFRNIANSQNGKQIFFSILSKFLSKEGLTTELSSAPLWFRLISVIASVTHSLVLHL